MKIQYDDLATFVPALKSPAPKRFLHIGCGTARNSRLPACFKLGNWLETRLDIDPNVQPDIVASITDMSAVEDSSVTAVWSSHNLEHLEDFEVAKALKEIHRVLVNGGFALITLPNLEAIANLIASGRVDDVIYQSPAGPITPLDMLFGHQASIRKGNKFMAHRTGFTAQRLGEKLKQAGFSEVRVTKGNSYDLWAVAVRSFLEKPTLLTSQGPRF